MMMMNDDDSKLKKYNYMQNGSKVFSSEKSLDFRERKLFFGVGRLEIFQNQEISLVFWNSSNADAQPFF